MLFRQKSIIRRQHFMVVVGSLQGCRDDLIIANVYAPQGQSEKNILWADLTSLVNNLNGLWILLGDFNELRSPEERLNSTFCKLGARKFNKFISNANLMEYSMGGRKYTYMMDGGEKLSKIDRILVNPCFMHR